ncbi:MAG TPA: UbiD family decarboxylase, partial [Methanomassiliicoccales archaeon]|nr:UbiD family decarboxylase [Methanomassiliicoccales archaeon]
MSLQSLLAAIPNKVVVDKAVPVEYEVTRRLLRDQKRPVLFNDLNGGRAVGNLFSTRESICSALGIKREELVSKLLAASERPVAPKLAKAPEFAASVKEKFDLTSLPVPKFYPGDGGRYITSAVAVSEFEGKRNLSFHRLMIIDERRMAIRLVPRHLYTMCRSSLAKGRELRIAFCIGVRPEVLLAAATSTSYSQDEMEIAASLMNECSGRMLKVGRTKGGLVVPSECEYVLEGRITSETTDEGPFVDITGTYDDVRSQPIVEIDRVCSRRNPIFHVVLPGGLEHYLLMGLPREPIIHRSVGQVVPKVHAVRLTEGGCCWLHGVVSITKNKEGDGVNAILAAFTGHPSMKQVTIIDEDVDVYDDRMV